MSDNPDSAFLFEMEPALEITVVPDSCLGFVARPSRPIAGCKVTGVHARTAEDAELWLRKMLGCTEA